MCFLDIIFLAGRTADYNNEPTSYVGAGIVTILIILFIVLKVLDKFDDSTHMTKKQVSNKKKQTETIKKEVDEVDIELQHLENTYGDHCIVMGEWVLLKEGGAVKQFRDSANSSIMINQTFLRHYIIANHPDRYYGPSIALKCLGVDHYGYPSYLPLPFHYADTVKEPQLEDDYEFIAKYGELAFVISSQIKAEPSKLSLNEYFNKSLPSWNKRLCNAIPDNYDGYCKEILEHYRDKPFSCQSKKRSDIL